MHKIVKNLDWALFTIIDRKMQDDRKSKIEIEALFKNPLQAENYNAPNPEVKRYLLPVDELEAFEEFYNKMQDGEKPKNLKFEYILGI